LKSARSLLDRIELLKEKPLCFTLNRSQDDDRLSAHFYDRDVLQVIKKLEDCKCITTIENISQSVKYSDGKWELHDTDYVPSGFPNCVLLLQVLNLRNDGSLDLNTGREKYIRGEMHRKWRNSQVKPRNIVMGIAGNASVGLSSLIPQDFPEANMNQNLGLVVLKDKALIVREEIEVNEQYVVDYLNSSFGFAQLIRYGGFRSSQAGLSTQEIKSILLPIPKKDIQDKIVENAHEHLERAWHFEEKFREHSRELSGLLEKKLGETLPNITNEPFACDPTRITDRFDYYSNSPDCKRLAAYLTMIEKSGKTQLVLGEGLLAKDRRIGKKLADELRTETFKYVDIDDVNKDVGTIDSNQEDILIKLPTRARQFIKENDVLIPTPIGSTKGITIVSGEYDGHICSTGFLVIKSKNYDDALLFFGLFKSEIVQRQLFYLQSGSVQPSIAYKTFEHEVKIPIPNDPLKSQLLEKVKQTLTEARTMKQQFEQERACFEESFAESIKALLQ